MPQKKLAYLRLISEGLAADKAAAERLIMAGLVYTQNRKIAKAGDMVGSGEVLVIKRRKSHDYVSRGGLKLAHGLEAFDVDVKGAVAADIGSSTGGFTDVLLRAGATKVYAVDVGYGELDWSLRQDDRVVVLERLNARHLTEDHIKEALDVVVCDASFIGLKRVLPPALSMLKNGGTLVALIKPQFEVAKGEVGKKGVVRDEALHKRVCEDINEWIGGIGFEVMGVVESPILGPEGNKEFLIGAVKKKNGVRDSS